MRKLWPFRQKHLELPTKTESPPVREDLDHYSVRYLVGRDERQAVYEWTDKLIFEFVPREDTADPVFRDDFFYLAAKLQAIEHPGLIKLKEFGEEQGRLYRVWERRRFWPLVCAKTSCVTEETKRLQVLLGALRTLSAQISPSLLTVPVRYMSSDAQGHFLARPPQTLKKWRTFHDCEDRNLAATFSFHGHTGQSEPTALSHQFALGTLVWSRLSAWYPYDQYPSAPGAERRHKDFGPDLTPVLYKLTELDMNQRYPTLDQAFKDLEKALALYETALRQGDLGPLWV